ncbi:MAG TPA: hypothetical protein VFW06_02695 [Acidimicrobiia bacterium]|nr:hypothetical protein [Acidimicrobiia bacterium]
MVEDLEDPRRIEPPFVLPEREMLEAWLEHHRAALLLECEGLTHAGRKARPLGRGSRFTLRTSSSSLAGGHNADGGG